MSEHPRTCHRQEGTGREPDNEAIGREMRAARKRKGLTLRQMAGRLELSPAYLSALELGRRNWHANIRVAYEVELKELGR